MKNDAINSSELLFSNIDLLSIPDEEWIPIYGTKEWLQIALETSDLPIKIWGMFYKSELVAWLPYQFKKYGPIIRWLPLYQDTFGGPYYKISEACSFQEYNTKLRAFQTQFLNSVSKQCHFATLNPLMSDPRELPIGWTHSLRATVGINYSKPFFHSKQAKDKIRRSANKGLFLTKADDLSNLEEAILDTINRHSIQKGSQPPKSLYIRISSLIKLNLLEAWSLHDLIGEIGYAFVIKERSKKTIRLWYPFFLQRAYKSYGPDYLYSYLIELYRNKGYEILDYCGADHPSLYRFKEKWSNYTEWNFQLTFRKIPFIF